MFSITTIPLSTNKPNAITRAAMEICCNANPEKSRAPMAIMIEIGSTSIMINDGVQPRNIKITTPTNKIPCIRLLKKSDTLAFTAGVCSNTEANLILLERFC